MVRVRDVSEAIYAATIIDSGVLDQCNDSMPMLAVYEHVFDPCLATMHTVAVRVAGQINIDLDRLTSLV